MKIINTSRGPSVVVYTVAEHKDAPERCQTEQHWRGIDVSYRAASNGSGVQRQLTQAIRGVWADYRLERRQQEAVAEEIPL